MILEFEYYLEKNLVRKNGKKDINRAKSLIKLAKDRLKTAKKIDHPNFSLEFAYEAIIESINAVMALDGYKSYSHEANISYLRTLGFPEKDIQELDMLRNRRHKSKYYGRKVLKEEAEDAIQFASRLVSKVSRIIKEKMK